MPKTDKRPGNNLLLTKTEVHATFKKAADEANKQLKKNRLLDKNTVAQEAIRVREAADEKATKDLRTANAGYLLGLVKTMTETAKALGQAEKINNMKVRIDTMNRLGRDQERANGLLLAWARDFIEGRI